MGPRVDVDTLQVNLLSVPGIEPRFLGDPASSLVTSKSLVYAKLGIFHFLLFDCVCCFFKKSILSRTATFLRRIVLNSVRQHNHFILKVIIRLHVLTID